MLINSVFDFKYDIFFSCLFEESMWSRILNVTEQSNDGK